MFVIFVSNGFYFCVFYHLISILWSRISLILVWFHILFSDFSGLIWLVGAPNFYLDIMNISAVIKISYLFNEIYVGIMLAVILLGLKFLLYHLLATGPYVSHLTSPLTFSCVKWE